MATKCDICGETGITLIHLLDVYQTEDIKEVCIGCEKVIDTHLFKIKSATTNINRTWLKRFVIALKQRLSKKERHA